MNRSVSFLTRTAVLLALALVFQMLKMNQWLTGPVINAILLLAVIFVTPWSGAIIGLVTPFVAFAMGIMKFFPMAPGIAVGNALLCLTFGYLRRSSRTMGVAGLVIGALLKAAAIFITAAYIVGIKLPVAQATFGWIQIATALIGGAIALAVAEALRRTGAVKPWNEVANEKGGSQSK